MLAQKEQNVFHPYACTGACVFFTSDVTERIIFVWSFMLVLMVASISSNRCRTVPKLSCSCVKTLLIMSRVPLSLHIVSRRIAMILSMFFFLLRIACDWKRCLNNWPHWRISTIINRSNLHISLVPFSIRQLINTHASTELPVLLVSVLRFMLLFFPCSEDVHWCSWIDCIYFAIATRLKSLIRFSTNPGFLSSAYNMSV